MNGLPELVVATAAIAGGAILLALALPARGALGTLVSVGLLFHALVIATLAIAGLSLRTLGPAVLLAIAIGWLVLGALAAWRTGAWPASRARLSAGLRTIASLLREPAIAVSALIVGVSLAWRVFLALRLPIVDYDGWSYHLVFADVWIQNQALTLVPQRIWTTGFPADGELLTTWLMAFTHSDSLAGFGSIIPLPLAMVSVAGLSRELGAARPWAILAGLLFGMTPALVALAGTSYVDASSVAFAVATWWLGLRVLRGDWSWSSVALLGLAGGLAIGTKGTNAPLTVPMLAAAGVAIVSRVARASDARERRSAAGDLVALAIPVLAFGAAWYLRNWLVYGNPLYPFSVGPFAGPTTFSKFALQVPALAGMPTIKQIVRSWAWDWGLLRYAYDLRPGGIGRAWFVILPFAIGGAWQLLRSRRWAALGLVVLVAGVTLLIMPMPWYARVTLFVPALGCALAGVAFTVMAAGRTVMPRVAQIATAVVVVLAGFSLVLADIRPNLAIRGQDGRAFASPGDYARFLLSSSAVRDDISLRADCGGFAQIPIGARVVPGGFNLLHGVVGPNLDRILTDPLPDNVPPTELADRMRALGATWLVTNSGARLEAVAESAGPALIDRGSVCATAHLWQLAQR
jgi:hypothetical protein